MAELGESRSGLLGLAVEVCPAGMIAIDERGRIVLVNREIERLFGYDRSELLGNPVELLIPERLRDAHVRHRSAFRGEPAPRRMGEGRELSGRRKDGSEFPVEIGINPTGGGDGFHVIAFVVDVTERRQAEAQLRQSQKMEAIGALAGGIAHDFNNLLLSIVGHTELAAGVPNLDPRAREDLEEVLRAAERGRQLVQRILLFSRQREVSKVRTSLEPPVREALALLRASLPATIEIRSSLDPRTPDVLSDETQIHQIVMNLATNAAHAMPGGGVLEIALAPAAVTEERARAVPGLRSGPHARLSARDSGHGMRPEVLARIFEPFFTTKPPGEGTGLGLSVIHGIVRSQGGAIDVRSHPGEGTEFDIYLPAVAGSGSTGAGLGRPPSNEGMGGSGPHVLVVDDEETLARLTRRQIEAMGFRVTLHTSSLEALREFRERPGEFRLLVTDNTMPGMTGSALAEEIHRLRPDLPILLVSGLAETADPEAMAAIGVRRMLGKPHTSAQLREAVESLLRP